MKSLIVATLAAVVLSGCVAVPAPYYSGEAYYPAPAIGVGVGVYSAPGYSYYGHRHHHRHHHRRHWR